MWSFSPMWVSLLSTSLSWLRHSQTTGAKVTGLWRCWWQRRSASRLSQHWHSKVWKLPTNGFLSSAGACQPAVYPGSKPAIQWLLNLTNQWLPNHRMLRLKCASERVLGKVLLCRIPSCWEKVLLSYATTIGVSFSLPKHFWAYGAKQILQRKSGLCNNNRICVNECPFSYWQYSNDLVLHPHNAVGLVRNGYNTE